MKRAATDVGFMFIAYNLRRLMNIINKTLLTKFLQELAFSFFEILTSVEAIIFKISHSFSIQPFSPTFYKPAQIASN